MTRLSIAMNPERIEGVFRHANGRTKCEAIEQALKEFVRHHRRQELQALAGSGLIEIDLKEPLCERQASIEYP